MFIKISKWYPCSCVSLIFLISGFEDRTQVTEILHYRDGSDSLCAEKHLHYFPSVPIFLITKYTIYLLMDRAYRELSCTIWFLYSSQLGDSMQFEEYSASIPGTHFIPLRKK